MVIRQVRFKIGCAGRYNDEEVCECEGSAAAGAHCGNSKICTGEASVHSVNEAKTVGIINRNARGAA